MMPINFNKINSGKFVKFVGKDFGEQSLDWKVIFCPNRISGQQKSGIQMDHKASHTVPNGGTQKDIGHPVLIMVNP